MIISFILKIVAWFVLGLGRLAANLIMRVRIEGLENVPQNEPLIVTANHFSWFDAPLITIFLPVRPVFLIATESQRFWFVRWFMKVFNGIPIWRGRIDRKAIRQAITTLQDGKTIAIFPEGGINPKLAKLRAQGHQIVDDGYDNLARTDGELTYPQPGTAYLAMQSKARILPIALVGTEKVLKNLTRFKRTEVAIHIGPVFGPVAIESTLKRQEQRQALNRLAEQIMVQIARLFPQEKRGPYQHI
ncbi:MAG: lysophospholipid acyltransferase family protein [Chloroflexota bacterium]